ncbi:MAG: integrase [Clostridium beijerinckii]|nr:integrase [Clostridium beijerinckii]
MANKKTIALTKEIYQEIISTIRNGFKLNNSNIRPNERISTALVVEANLGMRISDILNLRMSSFIKDGDRYRLDITEQKTSKKRTFTVPTDIYNFIQNYAYTNEIKTDAKLFNLSERSVQKHLELTCKYLNLTNISTHSFRKFFASQIYINNNYNIELVRVLLQHSSVTVTQKYIGIQPKEIERALNNHINLV